LYHVSKQHKTPRQLTNSRQNASDAVFHNATLRQTVYITQDASTIRLQLSNTFGGSDLSVTAATVALPLDNKAGTSAVQPKTLKTVTFSKKAGFSIPSGALVISDPIPFRVKAQSVLTVTLYLAEGQKGHALTGHPGSRTTSTVARGNHVSSSDLSGTEEFYKTDHWYFLSAVQGWLPRDRHSALVIVGDSITDGRGSTTNGNNRWPDLLLARMQSSSSSKKHRLASGIAVVNKAAGGNRVLADGLGPHALGRIERDVLARGPSVKYAMIYEGVNDLGVADPSPAAQQRTGDSLITAFDQMITRLHGNGIAVLGATITPMSGPGQAYDHPEREAQRQRVNKWIRTSGRFDAVVDFDEVVRDNSPGGNKTRLNPEYDVGDYLHLNPQGFEAMAQAVDLRVFERFEGGVWEMV